MGQPGYSFFRSFGHTGRLSSLSEEIKKLQSIRRSAFFQKKATNLFFTVIAMSKKAALFLFLYCFFCNSVYADELQKYLWQQETASCLVDEHCIIPDSESRDKRKKCIRFADNEELKYRLLVVGNSCSVQKETAENIVKILSALSASVNKSFSEIEVDFGPAEAVDAAVLYVPPVNRDIDIGRKEKKAAAEKSTEESAEQSAKQQKTDRVPVVLIRFKKDLYFDFNSSDLKETGSCIIRHFVHDVLAAAAAYKNITVIGHADSVGTDKENLILSKERSDIAVTEMQKEISRLGDSPNTLIESLGVGESQPIEHLDREKKSAANRRVEIFLSPSSIALHRAEKYLQCLYRKTSKDESDNESGSESGNEAALTACFTRYMMVQTE
ncbi:MAG: OmpA family protein [Candidatus Electrothrix sp. EH2]|nr:OmpA family protein [Candidatus Electrothrix sp. EH2]